MRNGTGALKLSGHVENLKTTTAAKMYNGGDGGGVGVGGGGGSCEMTLYDREKLCTYLHRMMWKSLEKTLEFYYISSNTNEIFIR